MKLSDSILLATIAAITGIAALLALIGLASSKWIQNQGSSSGIGLWNCNGGVCSSSAAALSILALLLLVASVALLVILILRKLSRKLRLLPLGFLIVATIFLLAATTSYLRNYIGYSFELMVAAHAFAFIASVLLAFWVGTKMYESPVTGTMRPTVAPASTNIPSSRILQ